MTAPSTVGVGRAELDAALLLLSRMGITPADLLAGATSAANAGPEPFEFVGIGHGPNGLQLAQRLADRAAPGSRPVWTPAPSCTRPAPPTTSCQPPRG